MEIGWIVFWYIGMFGMILLLGFLVMSVSLFLAQKNDMKNKEIDFMIRQYDDERAERASFVRMTRMEDDVSI